MCIQADGPRKRLLQEKSVETLLVFYEQNTYPSDLLNLFASLAVDPPWRGVLGDFAIVEICVHAMLTSSSNSGGSSLCEEVQESGCRFLHVLCFGEETLKVVEEGGASAAVFEVCRHIGTQTYT